MDKVFNLIKQEEQRQKEMIGLIPSENHSSPEVLKVLSSCLNSKYSEGYAGKRYYEGNQNIDEIEALAIERIKKLFNVPFVNVQAYSGSPANSAIYMALLEPGDTIMGLKLASGGHLTHGHPKVTFSGKFFNSIQYGLDKNARIDFEALEKLALEHKPKIIVAGTTAYPFILDFKKFSEIADKVGAFLVADISHITSLIIANEHPSPVPYADVIMSTTHKTFRGPRGAMILVTDKGLKKDPNLSKKIDSAIIPGLQGGPHNATTAGIAIAAEEASSSKFKKYIQQIIKNAQALAETLKQNNIKLIGDGTENHLILIDLSELGMGLGTQVAYALDLAGIYANRNTIPDEPCSPFYPSGLRIGTPLVTTRGMKELEMQKIGEWIARVIELVKDQELPENKAEWGEFIRNYKKATGDSPAYAKASAGKRLAVELEKIRQEVKELAVKYPLFKS